MNLYSLESNNVIGFILFILSFSLSYYLWGLFRKNNKKTVVTTEEKIVSPEFDLAKLLDTSKDKNYLYGKTDKYTWSQNEKEIDLILDLPNSGTISKKDINCTIKSKSIKVIVIGNTILDGNFYSLVDPDECSWQIDKDNDKQFISINLYKKIPTVRNQHWKCVLLGDEEVDTSNLGAPVFKIGDMGQMKDAINKVRDFKKV